MLRSLVLGTLCSALSALAQAPVVTGVLNGASFSNLLAPGTLAAVFGSGFGTSASGVTVQVGGKPGAVPFASPTQLNIQIPVEVQPGKGIPVVVAQGGQTSAPFNIDLETYAPGILTQDGSGTGVGIFRTLTGALVSAANPATPGETLTLYAIGLGPTDPVVPTGAAGTASTVTKPDLVVAGQAATVLFSGLAASAGVGVYQVNFTLPLALPGGLQPVKLLIGGQESNTVSLPADTHPFVFPNGIVNAASAIQAGLPNGDVAQGSILSIYGVNMGPASGVSATTWPLPTTQGLGGVTVQVKDSAGSSRYAVLLFVYAGQINAILPSATAPGQASLTVAYDNQTSAPQTFIVVESSVGLFARNAAGSGPGIVQQYHNGAPTLNDFSNSAIPGDVAVLWGTGLGPVTTDETQPPTQVNLGTPAEVWVGGQQVPPANIAYEGRSTSGGEDQINFVIPNISACHVPVFVKIGNVVSNTVSMSIGANGGMCSDAGNFPSPNPAYLEANGLREGSISLSRWTTTATAPVPLPIRNDSVGGAFDSQTWAQIVENSGTGVSVYGACTVSTSGAPSASLVTTAYLDAGTLSLVGPAGGTPIPIPFYSQGQYSAMLPSGYLSPGNYTLTATGGADVGAFTATLTLPPVFSWTNMDAITQVVRAIGVTVTWTGGVGDVVIMGSSQIATPQNAGAAFTCLEQASKGTFTVPPAVLLALPISATGGVMPSGTLTVTNMPASVPFNPNPPKGLDFGVFDADFLFLKEGVAYK